MNGENNLKNEIKLLRYISIAHYIIIIVSIYLNCVGLKEFYFSSKLIYILIKYSIIIKIIFIIIPTLLIFAFPYFLHKIKVLLFFKILTLCFLFISFIIGLLINISVWKTSAGAYTFKFYCPYHFNQSLLNKILENNDDKKKIPKFVK